MFFAVALGQKGLRLAAIERHEPHVGFLPLVARATQEYRLGRADFADYLIGLSHDRAGCGDTVSFDGRLETLAEFTVV